MDNQIGERIRSRRKQLKITMGDLATYIGYSADNGKTAIYQIETGKLRLKIDCLPCAAEKLQTSVYYLLGLTDNADITDNDVLSSYIFSPEPDLKIVHISDKE